MFREFLDQCENKQRDLTLGLNQSYRRKTDYILDNHFQIDSASMFRFSQIRTKMAQKKMIKKVEKQMIDSVFSDLFFDEYWDKRESFLFNLPLEKKKTRHQVEFLNRHENFLNREQKQILKIYNQRSNTLALKGRDEKRVRDVYRDLIYKIRELDYN